MYFITMAIICLVSGLSFSLLPSIEIHEQVKPFWEKVKETLNLLHNKKMRPLLVYFFFAGAAVSFYTGFLYKIV
jgi:Na+/melibiose symporter-like transporter